MSDETLLSCPFCGATFSSSGRSGVGLSGDMEGSRATCWECNFDGPEEPTLVAAIAAWNRRATPAPITPSAVDEAERRGAERATAQVVAWLRREADKFAKQADDMTMGSWQRRVFMSGASEYLDVAMYIERGHHIPPATESEAGRG